MAFTEPNITPPARAPVTLTSGRIRAATAVFTLATDGTGSYQMPVVLPRGARVVDVLLNASVSLGTSTISIGPATAPTKYRAAAVFTTTDAWVSTALNAAVMVELAADEVPFLVVAVAALPAAGRLLVQFKYVMD